MITCRQREWFRSFLHEDISATIEANFDVVSAVKEVDFSNVGGLEHLGTVQLGPRLNIITGELGKTRTLEAMKEHTGEVSPLPRPSMRVSQQSSGEILNLVLFTLLEIHPEGSALLIDDFLDGVNAATTQEALRRLAHHDKQLLLTVRPRMADIVRQGLKDADVVYVDLDAVGR